MRSTMTSILLASAGLAQTMMPVPDTPARFHALGSIQIAGRPDCTVSMRVEDLGSAGNPHRDAAFRNRWHYVIMGCLNLPLVTGMWTEVTVQNVPGKVRLDVWSWGSLLYVPLDNERRPKAFCSESNWQRVTITALDEVTHDLLIEEPIW